MEINLSLPVIAAGALIGYRLDGMQLRGAVLGSIVTLAILIYIDYITWNGIGRETQYNQPEIIEPEYEILDE